MCCATQGQGLRASMACQENRLFSGSGSQSALNAPPAFSSSCAATPLHQKILRPVFLHHEQKEAGSQLYGDFFSALRTPPSFRTHQISSPPQTTHFFERSKTVAQASVHEASSTLTTEDTTSNKLAISLMSCLSEAVSDYGG